MNKLAKQGFVKSYEHNLQRLVPNAITKFIFLDHKSILDRYNAIIRGFLNYYAPADNYFRFASIVGYILRHSCAKTLARKFNLRTRAAAFRKFGKNLEFTTIRKGVQISHKLAIPDSFKNTRKFNLATGKIEDPLRVMTFQINAQARLEEVCAVCGSTDRIEMHHVRHIRKMADEISGFTKLMAKLNRKQIPVCIPCHKKIHSGGYSGLSLNDL